MELPLVVVVTEVSFLVPAMKLKAWPHTCENHT